MALGTPVKIIDLAERLIRLSGKSIKRDKNNEAAGEMKLKSPACAQAKSSTKNRRLSTQSTAHAGTMRGHTVRVTAGSRDRYARLNKLPKTIHVQFKQRLQSLLWVTNHRNLQEHNDLYSSTAFRFFARPPTDHRRTGHMLQLRDQQHSARYYPVSGVTRWGRRRGGVDATAPLVS